MAEVVVPLPLRTHTDGEKRVKVGGRTVGEALSELIARFPGLEVELMTKAGTVRPTLHLFLGERDVHSLEGLATPLPEGARLTIVLPIAGG